MNLIDKILNDEDGEYWTLDGSVLFRQSDDSWASTCGLFHHTPEQMRARIEREQAIRVSSSTSSQNRR